jgi:hypothetical protein
VEKREKQLLRDDVHAAHGIMNGKPGAAHGFALYSDCGDPACSARRISLSCALMIEETQKKCKTQNADSQVCETQ